MDMTRRRFIANAVLLLLAPRKYFAAIRAGTYPGPVGPLDPARIRRPAKWAG